MSPESRELQLLLNDHAASKIILDWANGVQEEAHEQYEQLAQAAVFDDSKVASMRVAFGKYKALHDLYFELLDLSSRIGA